MQIQDELLGIEQLCGIDSNAECDDGNESEL